jgi:glycosyltransferase involved in cell wall biosynthesis
MIIAVNTRVLSGNTAISQLLVDYFEMMAVKYPTHDFVFITERESSPQKDKLKNIKWVTLLQQSNNPLLWKLWYNYKLPSAIKKMNADMLITADGVCSLRTKIPQCLFVNDLAFLRYPGWYSKKYLRFIKSNSPDFLKKAKIILTHSDILKNDLINLYGIVESKIAIIPPAVLHQYKPVNVETSELVKEKYTEGKEYFLFSGAIHPRSSLINLLKAFSLFKKRQKSNMQLVIASVNDPEDAALLESLRLYKYRNDVKLMPGLDENSLFEITASAYACINTSPLHNEIACLLNAMKCGVPVITGNLKVAIEIFGDAALLANSDLPESIAEKLMLLYKDENKKDELVKKGQELSANLGLDKTIHKLWQTMVRTMEPA